MDLLLIDPNQNTISGKKKRMKIKSLRKKQ